MHFLIIGYGSMGQRHAKNLRLLMPQADIKIYDPMIPGTILTSADAVIIASPAETHTQYMQWCSDRDVVMPFLVEKPLGISSIPYYYAPECAVGFNYRFHRQWDDIKQLAQNGVLRFYAREKLYTRYGATVGWTTVSHALDMALQLLGPARDSRVHLRSDGIRLVGTIDHVAGGLSRYDYDIDASMKKVTVSNEKNTLLIERDDECYVDEMQAWLTTLITGHRDIHLATLDDGEAVEQCLEMFHVW